MATNVALEGFAAEPRTAALRARIAVISHAIRWLTLGYALFEGWRLHDYWSDGALVDRAFAHFYRVNISGAAPWQWRVAECMTFLDWLVLAFLCWNVWRLFGRYLAGDIFSAGSAGHLQRIGLLGLFTVLFDVALRPAIVFVMAAHLADTSGVRHGYIRAEDLLFVVVSLVFVALGSIYRSAAEIADEHAQIV